MFCKTWIKFVFSLFLWKIYLMLQFGSQDKIDTSICINLPESDLFGRKAEFPYSQTELNSFPLASPKPLSISLRFDHFNWFQWVWMLSSPWNCIFKARRVCCLYYLHPIWRIHRHFKTVKIEYFLLSVVKLPRKDSSCNDIGTVLFTSGSHSTIQHMEVLFLYVVVVICLIVSNTRCIIGKGIYTLWTLDKLQSYWWWSLVCWRNFICSLMVSIKSGDCPSLQEAIKPNSQMGKAQAQELLWWPPELLDGCD